MEINRVVDKVGGIGTLLIVVESEDTDSIQNFIADLVPKLKELPKPYVRFVDYNTKEVREFYEKNKYLYIELEDLKTIHRRLKDKIEYEKIRQNPFFFELEDRKVGFDISDIEEKYKGRTDDFDQFTGGYYFSKDQKLAIVIVQPFGTATGTRFAKDLIAKVDSVVQSTNPTSYHPTLSVHYRGKYKRVLEEYQQIITDMLETLATALGLVAVSIFLYFFRFRIIFFLSAALGIGATWTFALTELAIGYLNSQTAFLGSIIVGNGVNSGIVLLARYLEERRKLQPDQAIEVAIKSTYVATLIAAVTTCCSFFALSFSQIKGLSQFGFIGTIGMFLCWVATYLFIPPMLILTEKVKPMVRGKQKFRQWEPIFKRVSKWITRYPKSILFISLISVSVSLTSFLYFLPNALEYDFSKLKK